MSDLDFELAIRPIKGNDYEVDVVRSPAGEARATMHFPFDGLALKTRLQALEIALLRSGGTRRQLDSSDGQTVRDFGRDLFDALISGDVRSRFDASLAAADHENRPLRVRLRFETPALAALPWEFLYDKRQPDYLVLSSDTPLVRYIEVPEVIKPLIVSGPLRILGVVASPIGMTALDVEREQTRIKEATADLQARGLIEVHWLDPATPRELQQALRREKWHIFHFAGHGGFDPSIDEGVIVLVDEQGGPVRLPATQLGRLLGDHKPLRLAVLNACEGARGSSHDLFSSTAATLVRRGTPAVVAMQYEITDDAAKEFGRSFYEAIADGSPVDIAVAEARKSVSIQMSNTLEWGTPVLFMRTDDGVLFRIRRTRRSPGLAPVVGTASAVETAPSSAVETAPSSAVQTAPSSAAPPGVPPLAPDATAGAEPAGQGASQRAATGTVLSSAPPIAAVAVPASPALATPPPPVVQRRLRGAYAVVGGLGLVVVGALAWSFATNGGAGASASPPGASSLAGVSGAAGASGGPSSPPGPSSSSGALASSGIVLTEGTIDIAVDLQTPGSDTSIAVLNGINLALTEADHLAGDWNVRVSPTIDYDQGATGTGRSNMTSIVGRDAVVAVVGPQSSGVAAGQIPVSNAAGLLQCSPSTASDGLTKPPGALDLRKSHPTQINFVRTVTTNAADAAAAAKFILVALQKTRVFVVVDDAGSARTRAALFRTYFVAHGGTVVDEASTKDADLASIVVRAKAADPDVLYFSGYSASQRLMADLFHATRPDLGLVPFVASGEIKANTTFRDRVGAEALNNVFTLVAAAQDFAGSTGFDTRYVKAYGVHPGPYGATAYECAAVILDAIKRAGASTSLADLREKVRAAAVDPAVTYDTVTGTFHFDANGDTSQLIVTVYRFNRATKDWGVETYIDAAE